MKCFDLVKSQHIDLSTKYTIYDIFIDNFLEYCCCEHWCVDNRNNYCTDNRKHYCVDNRNQYCIDNRKHYCTDNRKHYCVDNRKHYCVDNISTTYVYTSATSFQSNEILNKIFSKKKRKQIQLLLCCVSWAVKSFDDLCKPLSVIDLQNQWNKLYLFRVNIFIDILFMYYTKNICSSWNSGKLYIYC